MVGNEITLERDLISISRKVVEKISRGIVSGMLMDTLIIRCLQCQLVFFNVY